MTPNYYENLNPKEIAFVVLLAIGMDFSLSCLFFLSVFWGNWQKTYTVTYVPIYTNNLKVCYVKYIETNKQTTD